MTTTKRSIDAKNTEGQISLPDTVATSLGIPERNPGMPLDMDWVSKVHINRSAVERRAATMNTRRTVKKEWQGAGVLRAITRIDLTTPAGDDTPGKVLPLCSKAPPPVRHGPFAALGGTAFLFKCAIVFSYTH